MLRSFHARVQATEDIRDQYVVRVSNQEPSSMDYSLPRLLTKFGERAFSHAGPATWNSCPTTSAPWPILSSSDKKLSYRRGTSRRVVSNEILLTATQQCRNYLYDKS